MEVTEQCVVALTWVLKDTLGETLDTLEEPVEFVIGGIDLFPKIEQALLGHAKGATVELQLEPEEAFGDFNDQLLLLEARDRFPAELEEGMLYDGNALPPGVGADAAKDRFYTVTEIYPEHVVLDGNHPLSGIALRLRMKIEDVREATAEEIGSGTAGTGFFKVQPQAPGSQTLH